MHDTPETLAECNHLSAEDNYRRQIDELNRAAKKKRRSRHDRAGARPHPPTGAPGH